MAVAGRNDLTVIQIGIKLASKKSLLKTRKDHFVTRLSDQDSNLDRQNQNLQCYRYTIGQRKVPQMYRKISLNPNYLPEGWLICLKPAPALP